MDVWLAAPFVPTDQLGAIADELEGSGVAGLAVSDHVCVPADLRSDYPYTGKRAVLPATTELPDPLVLITALAMRTTRLRFMTNVLLVPLRHPVPLAKSVATVAALAPGRIDLGVGVGWMREEFDALDVDFAHRGRRTDEALGLLRRLWTGEVVEHRGTYFDLPPLAVRPALSTPVPIIVGGQSPPALRRAAIHGDGWVGLNLSSGELASATARLDAERQAAGTGAAPFTIRAGLKGRLGPREIRRAQALGVDDLIVELWQLAPPGTPATEVSFATQGNRVEELVAEATAA